MSSSSNTDRPIFRSGMDFWIHDQKMYNERLKAEQSAEDDIYKAKFQRDFPKYVDRKKEKYSWKKYYEKKMEKQQKKLCGKLESLKIRVAVPDEIRKTSALNARPTKPTIPFNCEPVTKTVVEMTKTIGSTSSSFNMTMMANAIESATPKGTKIPRVVPVGLSSDSKLAKSTKYTPVQRRKAVMIDALPMKPSYKKRK